MSWRGPLGLPGAPAPTVEDARAALAQALAVEKEAVVAAIEASDAYQAGTAPRRVLEQVRAARDSAEYAAKAARRHLSDLVLAEIEEGEPEEAPIEPAGQCDSDDEYHRRFPCRCGRHRGDEGAARLQAEGEKGAA